MEYNTITLRKPEEVDGFDAENGRRYMGSVQGALPFLKKEVISPFGEALKNYPGTETPDGLCVSRVFLGEGLEFLIERQPKKKKKSVKEIYFGFLEFLGLLREQYNAGTRRDGVVTFDANAYVELNELFAKYDLLNQEQDSDEVKRTVIEPKVDVPNTLVIPLRDYGELTAETAQVYLMAVALSKYIEANVKKPFEDELKVRTGYDNDNIPSETQLSWFQLEELLFRVQTVPAEATKYPQIMKTLFNATKNLVKTTGELDRVARGVEVPTLDVRSKEERTFVGLGSLEQRMADLLEEHTIREIDKQNLACYPVV
ncbi:MAG: hypothetical protein ABIJ18_05655 [archaeon]